MKCENCGSKNIVAHTDSELRRLHLLVWQCFDCGRFFKTGWDIGMEEFEESEEND